MDWLSARWIWKENKSDTYNGHVIFQRDLRLDAPVSEAVIRISADSRYRLRINGQWVNDGPSRAFPEHYSYDEISCGHLLRQGLNRIEVEVHYFGCGTFQSIPRQGGLLVLLQAELENGKVENIASDTSWMAAAVRQRMQNTLRRSCQLEPLEVYDASAGNGYEFSPAVIVCDPEAGPWKNLAPREVPLLTRREALIRRVIRTGLVEKEYRIFALNPMQDLFPGHTLINPGDILPVVCALELDLPREQETTLLLQNASAVLNAVELKEDTPVRFPAGKSFLIFAARSFSGHSSIQTGIGFPAEFEFTVSGMWKAPLKALARCAASDVPTTDFAPEIEAAREVVREKYRQIFKAAGAEEFKALLPECFPVKPEDFYSDAGCFSFQRQEKLPGPYDGVENPQALIYPDDRCTVVQPADGKDVELVCDLGEQNVGYWNFVIHAAAGTVVDISAVEYIAPDGTIQHVSKYPPGYNNGLRYICSGGWNRFTSLARRSGRYLFVILRNMTSPVRIQSLRLVESTYPVVPCGTFSSSNADLDRIYRISANTLKLCMEDTFTDCPLYEQTCWVGDLRNESRFALSCFGAPELVRRCLRLAGESLEQLPLAASQVPSAWGNVIPSFSFLWVIAIGELYKELGDEAFVREMFPAVEKMLDNALGMLDPENGLFTGPFWNFLEWSEVNIGYKTMLYNSIVLKGALDSACAMAELTGSDAGRFRTAAEKLVSAVNALWDSRHLAYFESVDSSGKPVEQFSVHTSMLALLFDIVPQECYAPVCSNIIEPRQELIGISSAYAFAFWVDALEKAGHEEIILEKMLPCYRKMLDAGSDTVWEVFGTGSDEKFITRSHCHGWSAMPLYIFPRLILGLKNQAPGHDRFTVSPRVDDLEYASGTRWTMYGPLSCSWRKLEGGKLVIDVTAPARIRVEFVSNPSLLAYDVEFNCKVSDEV